MAQCKFCKRRFPSEQSVKAHLRFCPQYKRHENKSSGALGTKPKAETAKAMASLSSGPQLAPPATSNPFSESLKSMFEAASKSKEQSPLQRRRVLLQEIKEQVINQYRTSKGSITTAMHGAAKTAIERELSNVPLEELSAEELYEIGAAIRDRVYEPVFEKQAEEAERRQAESQARSRKQREELGAWRRAHRQKEVLIDQAWNQTNAICEAKEVVGWHRLSVLCDINSRLDEFLTGDESITEAYAIIQSVLEARFAEADATLAAARAKQDAKWREEMQGLLVLCGVIALPVLAVKYPKQVLTIISWIEQIFGKVPSGTEATAKASSQTTSSSTGSSERPRRHRKSSVSPSSPCEPGVAADQVAETHNVSTMADAASASV